jgi:hypothetical protein
MPSDRVCSISVLEGLQERKKTPPFSYTCHRCGVRSRPKSREKSRPLFCSRIELCLDLWIQLFTPQQPGSPTSGFATLNMLDLYYPQPYNPAGLAAIPFSSRRV